MIELNDTSYRLIDGVYNTKPPRIPQADRREAFHERLNKAIKMVKLNKKLA